jgi:hypothetical protein
MNRGMSRMREMMEGTMGGICSLEIRLKNQLPATATETATATGVGMMGEWVMMEGRGMTGARVMMAGSSILVRRGRRRRDCRLLTRDRTLAHR